MRANERKFDGVLISERGIYATSLFKVMDVEAG